MKWHGCHWIDNHETRLQKSWIKFALYKAKSISKTNFNHLCVTKNCKGYVESHGNKNQWGKYQKKRQMTGPLFSIWQTAIAVLCWISAVYEIIPKLTVSENCLLHRLTSYQIYKSDTLTLSNSSCFQINWKDSIYYRKIGMRQNIIRLWYNSMQKWSKTHWNLENWNL